MQITFHHQSKLSLWSNCIWTRVLGCFNGNSQTLIFVNSLLFSISSFTLLFKLVILIRFGANFVFNLAISICRANVYTIFLYFLKNCYCAAIRFGFLRHFCFVWHELRCCWRFKWGWLVISWWLMGKYIMRSCVTFLWCEYFQVRREPH